MIYTLIYKFHNFKPKVLGLLIRFFFSGSRITIGKGFRCDSFPKIIVDKGCSLIIGNDVVFRRNIELRVHNKSTISIGNQTRIDRGVRLLSSNYSTITLNDKTRIGLYTVFNGGDNISIGNSCLISGFVYIQTSMHRYDGSGEIRTQGFVHGPITLENDCWLGAHAVIFPNVVLGEGCIIGSNAVVNKSFAAKSIIGGIPAKFIKSR